jgi:hypothetical protein
LAWPPVEYVQIHSGSASAQKPPLLAFPYGGYSMVGLVRQAEILQLTDPAAAQNIWASADHLAVDQAAWVPLANTENAELLSRRAGHFTLNADGLPQIDQLWVR